MFPARTEHCNSRTRRFCHSSWHDGSHSHAMPSRMTCHAAGLNARTARRIMTFQGRRNATTNAGKHAPRALRHARGTHAPLCAGISCEFFAYHLLLNATCARILPSAVLLLLPFHTFLACMAGATSQCAHMVAFHGLLGHLPPCLLTHL